MRQRLVETVYSQPGMLLAGAICTAGVAGAEWYKTGDKFWLAWLFAALLLFVGRWLDTRAFERANPDPTRWARRFAVGAWVNGAWWGSAAVAVLTRGDDPVAQFMFIAVAVGYIGAATVRSGSLPAAAGGQILLAEVPLFIACLLAQEPYIRLFSLFALLHVLSCLLLVRFMSQTRIALVLADERNGRLLERLRHANALLEAQAMTDELTGLANRRAFDATLAAEVQRAVRACQPLSLLLLDLDRFKLLNDKVGHQAGDECLTAVGAALSETVRDTTDTVARYGGEEFAVILPFTDAPGAQVVAERLRASVAALRWEFVRGRSLTLTVSVGGATVVPERGFEPAHLIAMADKALYAAKEHGRNRVSWL
ncbi:MAG: GGDEF domain-containing protein [Alphaproteobacteria bacterium]|nr:GGDEF domain-containing protein [Alphaproteobacteria bacterium]